MTTWATKQGVQMRGRNDNAYLNSINTVGRPQGEGGTRWLTIGSYSDVIVSPESATNMCCSGMHKVIYEPRGTPGHTDYFDDNWGIRTAPTRGACWGTTHYDHATMSADNVGPMVERGLSGVWRDWPANAPWYC